MVTSFGTPGSNVRQLPVQVKHSEASLVSVMVIARGSRRDSPCVFESGRTSESGVEGGLLMKLGENVAA